MHTIYRMNVRRQAGRTSRGTFIARHEPAKLIKVAHKAGETPDRATLAERIAGALVDEMPPSRQPLDRVTVELIGQLQ